MEGREGGAFERMSDKENRMPDAPELTTEKITPSIFGTDADAARRYADLLAAVTIDPDESEEKPKSFLELNGTPLLWEGSKQVVCGVSKARKTTYLTLITAILCGKDETAHGFKAMDGCRVLYIDTEQARHDTKEILKRVARICGATKRAISDRLKVLSMNKQDPDEIKGVMEAGVMIYKPNVVILDNWTDCVKSVMEEEECTRFSRQLRQLAEAYGIAIYSVVHANESARKDDRPDLRGWAKEEARKADGTTFLKDMGEYSQVSFRTRHRKPDAFAIGFADELPAIIDAPLPEPKGNGADNPDKYAAIVAQIPLTGMRHKELKAATKQPESTAKRWIGKMEELGLIKQSGGLYYATANAPVEAPEIPF